MLHRAGAFAAGVTLVVLSAAGITAELYRYKNESGVTVVNWAIPAAYVTNGYEVLNEAGQVVSVVDPVKTDTELEREAAHARVRDAESAAEAAQLERDTFLLRRYSTVADIQAARDRSLRELDIRISILNSQRETLAEQLLSHEMTLASNALSEESANQYEQDTVAALKAEIESLDEAIAGRKQQSAALTEAYANDMARFATLEDIVALRRQLSSPRAP